MTEKKQNHIVKNGIILILVFFLGVGSTYLMFHFFPNIMETTVTKLEKNVTIDDKGIADAVEKVYDSVVVVNTYINEKPYASGTGFVYKVEGNTAFLLTNNHVIQDADDVYIKFTDETVVKANVVGSDVYSDIAVLSVDKKYIKAIATIGSSEDLRLGDTAFAIGAPIDSAYSWSVTRGIISGKDRLVEVEMTTNNNVKTPVIVNTIQTDTAINNGNSGGPLSNGNGEVIGITSIKLASDKIEGMGFAIPIETAIKYAEELISGKSVVRPYLGVYMLDISAAYTNRYQYREFYEIAKEANITSGVIITEIESKSPAILAGIKVGDIVTKVDDHEVPSNAYLRYYLYNHSVGDEMKLTIIRDNKEKEITVKLASN